MIIQCAFPDIPSPTTPCAPVSRRCSWFPTGLTSVSPCRAIGGSSDFARCSQSRQSHKAVSSLCRGPFRPVCSTDYPFVSSCSPHRVAAMQLLSTRGGKHRHKGTSTLQCTLLLKRTSATVPVASSRRPADCVGLKSYHLPVNHLWDLITGANEANGEKTGSRKMLCSKCTLRPAEHPPSPGYGGTSAE